MAEEINTSTSEAPSLRDSIEAAFDESNKAASDVPNKAIASPSIVDDSDEVESTETTSDTEPSKAVAATSVQTSAPQAAQVEPAPASWKAGLKAKWAELPPDVRQEVIRRERDMSKAMGEASQSRQFASQFMNIVRPYEARIRSGNLQPLQAVERLFQADHVLSSAPPVQRAQYMAKLIREYGVDIKELDSALAGEGPVDPVRSQMDQLLEQRLAPLNQFLYQQQMQAAQNQRVMAGQATSEVEKMSQDATKYPHFEQVRENMADLIDFYATKGQYYSLEDVYKRAVTLDPELGAQALATQVRQAQSASAAASNNAVQRAQAASLSVAGTPSGAPNASMGNGSQSLRSTIEAAWAAHSGR